MSATGEDQSVVYSTNDSRTCNFRTIVGVETASINLMDYTFDEQGTKVDIKVRYQGGICPINLTHGGNTLEVQNVERQFRIAYGVPLDRCGFLVVTKHSTVEHGEALFVTHFYGMVEEKFCLVVIKVWYDIRKCRFMCALIGPSRHSSLLEVFLTMKKAYPPIPSNAATSTSGGNQTTITGLINNTGGPVHGNLNGSIINSLNVFLNYNCEKLY
jgi:hypothetical protein